ncbi:hypothetical protein C100_17805 [Sphingobium sp. C100]|nr:hypothetical protein C100_17805 [Sphingobium sp. C100]
MFVMLQFPLKAGVTVKFDGARGLLRMILARPHALSACQTTGARE